jgi:hypothetical protein
LATFSAKGTAERLFEDEQRAVDKPQAEREKLYAEIGRLTNELSWLKKGGRCAEARTGAQLE